MSIGINKLDFAELVTLIGTNDGNFAKNILNRMFSLCAKTSHNDILKLLVNDTRVNPDSNDNDAIKHASENGRDQIVEILLTNPNVNPAAQDNYSIRFASGNGHAKVIALLLKDPRVNPSVQHNNPIKCASRNGH